jgi:hypothetical protein
LHYYRLYERDLREQYRYEMEQILQNYEFDVKFSIIIREEQEDYINRMCIPSNIVLNEALLENVLAIIVGILTKIPTFIIGETGYVFTI